ncbi:MAG: dTMP kinase, partial [Acidobacteriota bacterium]|nr:dTMP kinase [Acidobacteriota bacterium]
KNRMDSEKTEFYERVRNAYLKIAEKEPNRFRIINAEGSTDEVQTSVVEIVSEFLGNCKS